MRQEVKSELWRGVEATVEVKVAVKWCLNLPGQSECFQPRL